MCAILLPMRQAGHRLLKSTDCQNQKHPPFCVLDRKRNCLHIEESAHGLKVGREFNRADSHLVPERQCEKHNQIPDHYAGVKHIRNPQQSAQTQREEYGNHFAA
jgi:hypothetical protein